MTAAIEAAILDLLARRGPGKTICPSEAARKVYGDDPAQWRPALKTVRRTAVALSERGTIAIYRKGKPVAAPHTVKGVIRLGFPPSA